MHEKDPLRKYIETSELRVYSDKIKVRLSKALAEKYDAGCYKNALAKFDRCLNMIEDLGITYPGNAHPILYIYIVPDEKYVEYLNFPKKFVRGVGGGRPVNCYDIDGFNRAYGTSQNKLENDSADDYPISRMVNDIHELTHLANSQFFPFKNSIIDEGLAEAVPLFVIGLEEKFHDYKEALFNLDESKVFSAKEIIESECDGSYGTESLFPGRSCSFRLSYISSYLFVRDCLESLVKKENLTRVQALEKFLKIIRYSEYVNEYLIFDIANALEISKEELLYGKALQMDVLKSIVKNENHTTK